MTNPLLHDLQSWQNFYIVSGTAAATLTGLTFIALTFATGLNLSRFKTVIRTFVSPTFFHFLNVLVIALLCFIPTFTYISLGSAILIFALPNLWFTFLVLKDMLHHYKKTASISRWIFTVILPVITNIILICTGVELIYQAAIALNLLALVSLCFLFNGLQNAWDMMIWITERKNESL